MRHRLRRHDGRPAASAPWRWRRPGAAFAHVAVISLLFLGLATPAPSSVEVRPGLADSEFLASDLEGRDAEVAAIHAQRLLESIASKDGGPDRIAHLNYLLEKLNPASLEAPNADLLTAGRIIDALSARIRTSGPPFPKTADVLLPLVGVGSPAFRDGVVKALQALVRHEMGAARGSASVEALAARFALPATPPGVFVTDASRILWETDGKALIGALVGALSRASRGAEAPAGATGVFAAACLDELRGRLHIDFAGVEGWEKWWEEMRALPLDGILADGERRSREERLANWRKLLRRIRETGDGERLLLAIEDTLEGVYSPEMRVAAVGALGDFADWALELRIPEPEPAGAGSDPAADPRASLLARAVRMLIALQEPRGSRLERRDVLRAGLAALRRYQLFLEKEPKLLSDVSTILVRRLQALSSEGPRPGRDDLLETLRLAGALRVPDALGFVEGLLGSAPADVEEDLEVLTVAVSALGKLLEKGTGQGSSSLLMAQFRKPRSGPEKAVRELRRTCVTALASGSQSASVRAELLEFFREVLHSAGDRDLRIPVLLGLGTLARQREPGALEALARVLEDDRGFEAPEIIAAADSIAYVGGEAALSAFVAYSTRAKDKAVEEHLVKKIAGLIEEGTGALLADLLEKLEARAFEEDSTKPCEIALAIAEEPAAKAMLAPEKLGSGSVAEGIQAWWKANLVVLRSRDLIGDEEGFASMLAALGDLLLKEGAIREKAPWAAAEMSDMKLMAGERASAASRLAKGDPAEDPQLKEEMKKVVSPERSALGRWRGMEWLHRRIAALEDVAARSRIAGLWRAHLAAPESEAVWRGLPEGCRARHLARLDALAGGG